MAEQDNEFKAKVTTAKEVIKKMATVAQEKDMDMGDLQTDIETYLTTQGLTQYDLKADGDKKKSNFAAFTNGFNKEFKNILQAVVPQIANTLDMTSFFVGDLDEYLQKEKDLKSKVSNTIEDLFTNKIIPGQDAFVDPSFTPEGLGQRIADQAGEELVKFLPLMLAPSASALGKGVQGFQPVMNVAGGKVKELGTVLNNSVKNILNTYVKNPGRAVATDAAAITGYAAGENVGTAIQDAARETGAPGYADVIPLDLTGGLAGATTATLPFIFSPKKTINAVTSVLNPFKGAQAIIKKLKTRSEKKQERKAIKFIKESLFSDQALTTKAEFDDVVTKAETEFTKNLNESKEISNLTKKTLATESNPDAGNLKLSIAEQSESPSLTVTQSKIEADAVGKELDDLIVRRTKNVDILDETLDKQIPETEKNINYILDVKKEQLNKTSKKIGEQILAKETDQVKETESLFPSTTAKESGSNLRNIIETTADSEAKVVLDSLDKIPAAKLNADPKILDDLVGISSSREFQTGTDPSSINPITKIMEDYFPTERAIFDDLGNITGTEVIPPIKNFTNQDMFDIWLSLGKEESSLLGKSGIENTIKLSKITEMRSLLKNQLEKNLQDTLQDVKLPFLTQKGSGESGDKFSRATETFFDNLNTYVNTFEKGVLVKSKNQTNTGYQLKDEAVADSFFQANNVEAMDTFTKVFSDNAEAITNMQNSILDRIISKSLDPKTNLINTDKLKRFLVLHGSVLESFSKVAPEFVSMLRNSPKAITDIATRLNTLKNRKKYVDQEQLKEAFSYLGQTGSKKLNFSSADEYVQAAIKDPNVMKNVTEQVMKFEAGDAWVKSVLEQFTKLRINKKTGTIDTTELRNLNNFLIDNKKSLEVLFDKAGPAYKDQYKNLELILKGLKKINLVDKPKGSALPSPATQMKETFGTDIPAVMSRGFAVASDRVGIKYTVAETLGRFFNTLGKKNYNLVLKDMIYEPELSKIIAKMTKGGEASMGDLQYLYGYLAKMNGTIGTQSEKGFDENDSLIQEAINNKNEKKLLNVNPQSSLSNTNVISPVSKINTVPPSSIGSSSVSPSSIGSSSAGPVMNSAPGMAAVNSSTMNLGQQLFGNNPREITFAAKGGIMNTMKATQRVL